MGGTSVAPYSVLDLKVNAIRHPPSQFLRLHPIAKSANCLLSAVNIGGAGDAIAEHGHLTEHQVDICF